MIPYVLSGDASSASVTFFAKGRQHTVSAENPNFREVVTVLTAAYPSGLVVDVDALIGLAEPVVVVIEALANTRLAAGVVEIRGGSVLFNGKPVNGHLVDRILSIAQYGDVTPWVNFMTNLFQNPSFTARSELYLWLEKAQLPVTPDGHFLAYKKVREDFHDSHSGTLDYSPGKVVEMPRHEVDDDRNNVCSSGLHFCSADYLPQFGAGSSARVVLVKINPADVVSIPSDYDNTKGRAWRIEVVEDVTEAYAEIAWPAVASTSIDFGFDIDAEDDSNDDYYDDVNDYGRYDDDDDMPAMTYDDYDTNEYYEDRYGMSRDEYYGVVDGDGNNVDPVTPLFYVEQVEESDVPVPSFSADNADQLRTVTGNSPSEFLGNLMQALLGITAEEDQEMTEAGLAANQEAADAAAYWQYVEEYEQGH